MATKVLMFGWEFPPQFSGGLGIACLGLTRALSKEGFDITFVLPRTTPIDSNHIRVKFAGLEKIKFSSINSPLSPYLTSGKYKKLFGRNGGGFYGSDLLSEVRRYALVGGKLAVGEEFDVIYAHDWLSFGAGVEAKHSSGKPLIVHIHATEFDRCGGRDGVNSDVYDIERGGMEEADAVIAVSQFTKDIVVREYGIPEEKVFVVHNGIDDATFPYHYRENDKLRGLKAAGYRIVLYWGRLTLQKGVDYLIRAARKVVAYDDKVVFLIVGSGDMKQQLMQEVSYYKMADKILFEDFLRGQELADVVSSSDVVVMPSVSEPFGIVPLEAMKLRVPVIISKQSGVSEVVKHALKVDFWDIDEMANKIISVLRHDGLSRTLSQHGSDEVLRIDWGAAAQKIKKVISDVFRWAKKRVT